VLNLPDHQGPLQRDWPCQLLEKGFDALQVVRLRAKLTDAAGAVKGMFGIKSEKDPAVAKLEALQVRALGSGRIARCWCKV
jgi:hypothetical protein